MLLLHYVGTVIQKLEGGRIKHLVLRKELIGRLEYKTEKGACQTL